MDAWGLELTAHSGSIEGVVIKKSFPAPAVAMERQNAKSRMSRRIVDNHEEAET
jgi:hypothetical protein